MEKLGFTRDDLALFGMQALEERDRLLKEKLRPRLEDIAYRFASPLSRLTGHSLAAVVHTPVVGREPCQAAALFLPSGSDGENSPHFAFGISRGGVHVRLAVRNGAPDREAVAKRLAKGAAALAKEFSGTELRRYDVWDGRGIPAPSDAGKSPFWKDVAEHFARQNGQLDLGLGWPEARAVLLSYEDLLPAFRSLIPLYRRLTASDERAETKPGRRSAGAP
jgi:uncharacterized protein YktB (UPF0637 family)